MCGEYAPDEAGMFVITGSSPRVWGIPEKRSYWLQNTRFIPTCVGNTKSGKDFYPTLAGSSPRVWGIR